LTSNHSTLYYEGIKMPTYRKNVELKGFDLRASICPMGLRHFLRFLPYLTGQDARFTITLETISGKPREFSHTIKSYFISADKTAKQISHDEILISPISQTNKLQSELSIPFISLPGHYSIEFTFEYHNMAKFEPMVELYASSKDLLFIRLVNLIVGGIIGGVIGWILAHI